MIYMTPEYMLDASSDRPIKRARILWDNVLAGATFTATSARDGFAASNARARDTASWWWPVGAGTITMTLPAAAAIDCVGIAAHTLGTDNAGATVQGLIGGVWTTLHPEIEPDDNEAIMVMFRRVTVTAVRITLDASARIGVVYAGPELVMPQMVYSAAPALNLTLATSYETNKSQTGQFLGRSIIANARPFNPTWTHLAEPWVRSDFLPFILAARRDPFFCALRPYGCPEDVGYVWTASDIVPQRMGLKNYMQVQISGEAHAGPEL